MIIWRRNPILEILTEINAEDHKVATGRKKDHS